jgi:hypothetical protein
MIYSNRHSKDVGDRAFYWKAILVVAFFIYLLVQLPAKAQETSIISVQGLCWMVRIQTLPAMDAMPAQRLAQPTRPAPAAIHRVRSSAHHRNRPITS